MRVGRAWVERGDYRIEGIVIKQARNISLLMKVFRENRAAEFSRLMSQAPFDCITHVQEA